MRQIILKMNPDAQIKDHVQQSGDHRVVQLVMPLPKAPSDILSCVLIKRLDGELEVSQLITVGAAGDAYISEGMVYYTLYQPASFGEELRVQLECYSGPAGAEFVARSKVSERITFRWSLAGSLAGLPEVSSNPSAISELIGMLGWLRELQAASGGDTGDLAQRVAALEQRNIVNDKSSL
jgi:hypothetical protein